MKKKYAMLAVLISVVACSTPTKHAAVVSNIATQEKAPIDASPSAGGGLMQQAVVHTTNPDLKKSLADGAVKSGDLYYIAIGKDNSGCKYYTSYAPGKVTLTAVYYKKQNGEYTNNRTEATCD